MSYTISTAAHELWTWLPAATVGLQFATALIRFSLTTAPLLTRRHRGGRTH